MIRWAKLRDEAEGLSILNRLVTADARLTLGARGVRARHVVKGGTGHYTLFNEGQEAASFRLETPAKGRRLLLNTETLEQRPVEPDALLSMKPHELTVVAELRSQ